MSTNRFVNSEPIRLDRLKFRSSTRLSDRLLAGARIEQYEDIALNQLVISMEVAVLAEKLVGEMVQGNRTEPATWLDYLKRDVWYADLSRDRIMRWAAKRWPVKYRKLTMQVEFERYALFPNSTLDVPELGKSVVVEKWGETRWTET